MGARKSAASLSPAATKPVARPKPTGTGLRKFNAYVALATILALIYHSGTMGWSLWTGWYNRDVSVGSAWTIGAFVCVHVFLILVLFFFFAESGTVTYKREPHSIMIQRISAIAILILLHFHIIAFQKVATGEKIDGWLFTWYVLTELAFFGFVMMHVAVSVASGLARVHWVRKPTTIKGIERAAYWICGICFVVYTSGMIHFYLGALS